MIVNVYFQGFMVKPRDSMLEYILCMYIVEKNWISGNWGWADVLLTQHHWIQNQVDAWISYPCNSTLQQLLYAWKVHRNSHNTLTKYIASAALCLQTTHISQSTLKHYSTSAALSLHCTSQQTHCTGGSTGNVSIRIIPNSLPELLMKSVLCNVDRGTRLLTKS